MAVALTPTTMTLKLLVDARNKKVLLAEAEKDFVDFLFNILTLPLGSTIKLITKPKMVGSLGTLYDSIENLNETYMASNKKENILNPKVLKPVVPYAPLPEIAPPTPPPPPKNYYRCASVQYSICREFVTDNPNTTCPQCKKQMNFSARFAEPPPSAVPESTSSSGEGGYVRSVVTYMVTADLVVKPMSTSSCIALLSLFNVRDVVTVEEKVITFGLAEGINLLKASLESKTVLTDVFLKNQKFEVKKDPTQDIPHKSYFM